jgi:hypothetical protein
MPLFRLSIVKQYVGAGDLDPNPFRNVYTVEAADLAGAIAVGADILPLEQAIFKDLIHFLYMHAKSPTLGTFGRSAFIDEFGTVAVPGDGELLPMWNVVRCNFPLVDAGRPEIKYLRLPLLETETVNGNLTLPTVAAINDNYAGPLAALPGFVSPTGAAHDAGQFSTSVQVGMRQQSWHRRTRPGFHRGYVPN